MSTWHTMTPDLTDDESEDEDTLTDDECEEDEDTECEEDEDETEGETWAQVDESSTFTAPSFDPQYIFSEIMEPFYYEVDLICSFKCCLNF